VKFQRNLAAGSISSVLDFNILDVVSYQQLLPLSSCVVVGVIGELGIRFNPNPDNQWSWVFVNLADPDNVDTRPFLLGY